LIKTQAFNISVFTLDPQQQQEIVLQSDMIKTAVRIKTNDETLDILAERNGIYLKIRSNKGPHIRSSIFIHLSEVATGPGEKLSHPSISWTTYYVSKCHTTMISSEICVMF